MVYVIFFAFIICILYGIFTTHEDDEFEEQINRLPDGERERITSRIDFLKRFCYQLESDYNLKKIDDEEYLDTTKSIIDEVSHYEQILNGYEC